MPSFTSTHFASACAAGTDWRDTSKKVLEQLDAKRTKDDQFNFGFIYISDRLAEDATSILNLFKSVLNVESWVGSIGLGIIGSGAAYLDEPSISAMVGTIPDGEFCLFPDNEDNDEEQLGRDRLKNWLLETMPVLGVVHGDPTTGNDMQDELHDLELETNAFLVGGLTSARTKHHQIAETIQKGIVSGALFSDAVPVATTVSQGCKPIGAFHTVTKSDGDTILELNDRNALDVLQDDLRANAAEQSGRSEEDLDMDIQAIETSEQIPEEFKPLFKKQIHIGLPVSRSDQKEYLVRNITSIDAEERSITFSESLSVGQNILFVERDPNTISADLSHSLVELRKRIQHERGEFAPKAALYISCVARAFSETKSLPNEEIKLIQDIIGPVPITGFYASGEINKGHIYGYTGVLTLFF